MNLISLLFSSAASAALPTPARPDTASEAEGNGFGNMLWAAMTEPVQPWGAGVVPPASATGHLTEGTNAPVAEVHEGGTDTPAQERAPVNPLAAARNGDGGKAPGISTASEAGPAPGGLHLADHRPTEEKGNEPVRTALGAGPAVAGQGESTLSPLPASGGDSAVPSEGSRPTSGAAWGGEAPVAVGATALPVAPPADLPTAASTPGAASIARPAGGVSRSPSAPEPGLPHLSPPEAVLAAPAASTEQIPRERGSLRVSAATPLEFSPEPIAAAERSLFGRMRAMIPVYAPTPTAVPTELAPGATTGAGAQPTLPPAFIQAVMKMASDFGLAVGEPVSAEGNNALPASPGASVTAQASPGVPVTADAASGPGKAETNPTARVLRDEAAATLNRREVPAPPRPREATHTTTLTRPYAPAPEAGFSPRSAPGAGKAIDGEPASLRPAPAVVPAATPPGQGFPVAPGGMEAMPGRSTAPGTTVLADASPASAAADTQPATPASGPAKLQNTVVLPFSDSQGAEGRIRLALRGDTVQATIFSAHPQMTQKLEAGLPELQRSLADHGFADAQVEVRTRTHEGGESRTSHRQPDHQAREDRAEQERQRHRREEREQRRQPGTFRFNPEETRS